MRRSKRNLRGEDLGLYLVLDPTTIRKGPLLEVLERALLGGVNIVQLREKSCSDEEFISLAQEVLKLTEIFQVPMLINDRVHIVPKVRAQGVHVGQGDMHWREARHTLGPDAIIGVSASTDEQIQRIEDGAVDYLGVGPVFSSTTKITQREPLGVEGFSRLRSITDHLLVAIGGIHLENAESLLQAGADGVAVVSAICGAVDPWETARLFSEKVRGSGDDGLMRLIKGERRDEELC